MLLNEPGSAVLARPSVCRVGAGDIWRDDPGTQVVRAGLRASFSFPLTTRMLCGGFHTVSRATLL